MEKEVIISKLDELIQISLLSAKEMFSLDDAARYTGLSKAYLYRLTSSKEIPHYKPQGRGVYFKRDELNQWLSRNRVKTNSETEQEAAKYILSKSMR